MVAESSEDELGRLDLDLSRKSKQLNLTSRNVRAILHVSASLCQTPSATCWCAMLLLLPLLALSETCGVHLCCWSGGDHP